MLERYYSDKKSWVSSVRKWQKQNVETVRKIRQKWRVNNREKNAQEKIQWRVANPKKVLAQKARRRAKERGAPGYNYTTDQHIIWRWEMWGNKCCQCGAPAEHTDHMIPLGVGGPHWPSNLRPMCGSCNCKRPKNGSDLPTRKNILRKS